MIFADTLGLGVGFCAAFFLVVIRFKTTHIVHIYTNYKIVNFSCEFGVKYYLDSLMAFQMLTTVF